MNQAPLKPKIQEDLRNSLKHLEYSFKKVQKMNLTLPNWTEEELEVLESYSSRFARASDLFVSRYLRLLALEKDPAFQGTFIDLLNFSEKAGLIASARIWFRIRELRNIAAHEYSTDEFSELLQELVTLTPTILGVHSLL